MNEKKPINSIENKISESEQKLKELKTSLSKIESELKKQEEKYKYSNFKEPILEELVNDINRIKELIQNEEKNLHTSKKQKESIEYRKDRENRLSQLRKQKEEAEAKIKSLDEVLANINKTLGSVTDRQISSVSKTLETVNNLLIQTLSERQKLETEKNQLENAIKYLNFNSEIQNQDAYTRLWENALKENEQYDIYQETKEKHSEEDKGKAKETAKGIAMNNARWNANPIKKEYEESFKAYKSYLQSKIGDILGIEPYEGIENINPNSLNNQLDEHEIDEFLELKNELYKITNRRIDYPNKAMDVHPIFEEPQKEENKSIPLPIRVEPIIPPVTTTKPDDLVQKTNDEFFSEIGLNNPNQTKSENTSNDLFNKFIKKPTPVEQKEKNDENIQSSKEVYGLPGPVSISPTVDKTNTDDEENKIEDLFNEFRKTANQDDYDEEKTKDEVIVLPDPIPVQENSQEGVQEEAISSTKKESLAKRLLNKWKDRREVIQKRKPKKNLKKRVILGIGALALALVAVANNKSNDKNKEVIATVTNLNDNNEDNSFIEYFPPETTESSETLENPDDNSFVEYFPQETSENVATNTDAEFFPKEEIRAEDNIRIIPTTNSNQTQESIPLVDFVDDYQNNLENNQISSLLGSTVKIKPNSPIYRNAYSSYLEENKLNPYFPSDKDRVVIGLTFLNAKDNKIRTVYAYHQNAKEMINNIIKDGGELISVLTEAKDFIPNYTENTTLSEADFKPEGWYNPMDIESNLLIELSNSRGGR